MARKKLYVILGVILALGITAAVVIISRRNPLWRGGSEKARLAIEPKFAEAGSGFKEGLMSAGSGNQWCFFDQSGKCVIDLKEKGAQSVWPFREGMAKFEKDGKQGFLDRAGNVAIAAKYDQAWSFSEGVAAVKLGERWGFLDKTGGEAIPFRFANAEAFSDGLAHVNVGGSVQGHVSSGDEIAAYIMEGGKEGYIDRSGKLAIESKFDWIQDFADGLARVNVGGKLDQHGSIEGGKWGLIDKTGGLVVKPVYDSIGKFEDGLASVKAGEAWGFIDRSGNVVIPPRFEDWGHFSEGVAAVREAKRSYGYIDKSGNYVIEPRLSVAGDFVEGLAPASADGTKFGFIDKSGAWVIRPTFYGVEHFSSGVALIHLPSGEGYTRESFGHLCKFGGSLSSSIKGLKKGAAVQLNYQGGFVEETKKMFIDRAGKPIVRREYEDARSFADGMAAVKVDGKWGYLVLDPAPR